MKLFDFSSERFLCHFMHGVFVIAYTCFINQVAQKINYAKNLYDEVKQTVEK